MNQKPLLQKICFVYTTTTNYSTKQRLATIKTAHLIEFSPYSAGMWSLKQGQSLILCKTKIWTF